MRGKTMWIGVLCLGVASGAAGQVSRVPDVSNLLTRWLDWADIHRPTQVGRLTVFPITLSRGVETVRGVLTMQQALGRGLLSIEELDSAVISKARFINKSRREMIFLMAGEMITGGKQNRTLQTDALLAPGSSTVLPLYCVQKGRWTGGRGFKGISAVAPQAVRERAAQRVGQDAIWGEVARANKRLRSGTASQDLYAAMAKPENVRRFAELRRRIVPHLPRGCVGVVVVTGGRIAGADLFNAPELFAAMRDKVLNSYLGEYGWPLPVRPRYGVMPIRVVSAEQVREYLRDCYRSRLVAGERRGVGRVYSLRGRRSGQTLGYNDRCMVHTALTGSGVLPVRPRPIPPPRPLPPRR